MAQSLSSLFELLHFKTHSKLIICKKNRTEPKKPASSLVCAAGFHLPEFGLERFCRTDGSQTSEPVFLLALLDSFDPDAGDGIRGQVDETLETNNVVAAQDSWSITGLDCSETQHLTTPRCTLNGLVPKLLDVESACGFA